MERLAGLGEGSFETPEQLTRIVGDLERDFMPRLRTIEATREGVGSHAVRDAALMLLMRETMKRGITPEQLADVARAVSEASIPEPESEDTRRRLWLACIRLRARQAAKVAVVAACLGWLGYRAGFCGAFFDADGDNVFSRHDAQIWLDTVHMALSPEQQGRMVVRSKTRFAGPLPTSILAPKFWMERSA